MTGHVRRWVLGFVVAALAARLAAADAYDPPATYYNAATGTGATLKSQLNDIIDGHTTVSYDSLRTALQVTDADPNSPGRMILVYNRESLNVAAINPGGSIPGWDSAATWNREHTWPQSRGLGNTSAPDGSDLHHLRPSRTTINTARDETNFGGAFGHAFGEVTDDGVTFWYPGDADAGMIARSQFYMAVRYDGVDAGTVDLELGTGDVLNVSGSTDPPPQLGNFTRLLEWHYAAPPDSFERGRQQIVYDDYQHNRNSFIDRPEFVWSVFVDQANDSRIAINGATVGADGSSLRNVDLGRVFVGGAVPAAQLLTLEKSGTDGTYFEVTTSGAATSSLSGRFNAFRTNQTDSKSITVGLNTTTATAGAKTGTVTINNLDITAGGGADRGANDANDLFNVSLAVLDHATPSFAGASEVTSLMYDFGSVAQGSTAPTFGFDVFNFGVLPAFTADLDFDSFLSSGDASTLSTNLADSAGSLALDGGMSHEFTATFDTATPGDFSATYTLSFSDENLLGALTKSLTLTLMGEISAALLAGDYNRDGFVDAVDYTVWRDAFGSSVAAFEGADGSGNMLVDLEDYQVWKDHFGQSAGSGAGGAAAARTTVPEPASWLLVVCATAAFLIRNRGQSAILSG